MMCEQYSFVRDEFRLFLSDAIQFIGSTSNDVEFRHCLAKETGLFRSSVQVEQTIFIRNTQLTVIRFGSRVGHLSSTNQIHYMV